jgi:hypothetical protein
MSDEIKPIDMRSDMEKTLAYIVKETLWMARRYADGRRTYAPTMVNEAIVLAKKCGIDITEDPTNNKMFARDGDFGEWNPELNRFEKE